MKYIAYDPVTGQIKYYYESPVVITEAPENLSLLLIDNEYQHASAGEEEA